MNKPKQSEPSFPEPSLSELSVLQRQCLKEFSVKLRRVEARHLIHLLHEKEYFAMELPLTLDSKLVLSFHAVHQEDYGTELTDLESRIAARSMLMVYMVQQQVRVDKEIRKILASHRVISPDSTLSNLITEILFTHYGITLTEEDAPKALRCVSRAVWYIDGIHALVDKPLRDLLRYVKRRKVENGVKAQCKHDELRKFLDEMVKQNALATDFEPLYRDEETMKLWRRGDTHMTPQPRQ